MYQSKKILFTIGCILLFTLYGCTNHNEPVKIDEAELKENIRDVEKSITEKKQTMKELKENIKQKSEEIQTLEKLLQDQENTIEKLNTQFHQADSNDTVTQEIKDIVTSLEVLDQDLQDMLQSGIEQAPNRDWLIELYLFMPTFAMSMGKYIDDVMDRIPANHQDIMDDIVRLNQIYAIDINGLVSDMESLRIDDELTDDEFDRLMKMIDSQLEKASIQMKNIKEKL